LAPASSSRTPCRRWAGVEGLELADEDGDGAALGKGLLDEGAGGPAGGVVIGADVGEGAHFRERRCPG